MTTWFSDEDIEAGNAKLLELASILDASDVERQTNKDMKPYCQRFFTWSCQSPACALGHWAHKHPEGWILTPVCEGSTRLYLRHQDDNGEILDAFAYASNLFALTHGEWDRSLNEPDWEEDEGEDVDPNDPGLCMDQPEVDELFDEYGCGSAATAAEAAAYIRQFVARREKEIHGRRASA